MFMMLTFLLSLCCLTIGVFASPSSSSTLTKDNELRSQLRPGFKLVDIIAHDGIALEAIFFDPEPKLTATNSTTKNPVIIFISSWGLNKWEYIEPANRYADKGYTVVSYTARGFWGSGGVISLAGTDDQKDVSTVIDWVLDSSDADPTRIGLSGISYGGGLSLLGAAYDNRVKAITAMSCWIDMATSLLGNGETMRDEAVRMLQAATLVGTPSDDLEELFQDYFNNINFEWMVDMTANSSVINSLDKLNQNNAAIFIANAIGDSLFTPNQFVQSEVSSTTSDFFTSQLQVSSKHIEFSPGDHAGPEMGGLFGLPNEVWKRSEIWMDYYLLSGQDPTTSVAPISNVILMSKNGDIVTEYDRWEDVTSATQVYALGAAEALTPTVSATATAATTATNSNSSSSSSEVIATISTGAGCGISAGVAMITATAGAVIDKQKPVPMGEVSRQYSAIFTTTVPPSPPSLGTSKHVLVEEGEGGVVPYRGIPLLTLHINPTINSNSNTTTTTTTTVFLVIYLLAVDPSTNTGYLFSSTPWTFKQLVANSPTTVVLPMTLTLYDLPVGFNLAVVVGVQDQPLYLDQNSAGMVLQVLEGSTLAMPLGSWME